MSHTKKIVSYDHFGEFDGESKSIFYSWPVYQPLFSKRIYKQLLNYRSLRRISLNEIEYVIGSIYNQSKEITLSAVLECEVYVDNRMYFADIKSLEFQDEMVSAAATAGSDLVRVLQFYSGKGPISLTAHLNGFFWLKKTVLPLIEGECKVISLNQL